MIATTNFKTCILHAAFQLVDNPSYFYNQAVQFCLTRFPLPATMGLCLFAESFAAQKSIPPLIGLSLLCKKSA
eukprot:1019294-Prorocentrum_lima.AAC.1